MMNKSFASLISYIFSPVFIFIIAAFLLTHKMTRDIPSAFGWTVYTFIFILAILIFTVYGLYKGFFSDFDISKKEQRPLFFRVSFILTLIYMSGLYLYKAPRILKIISFDILLGIILVAILNNRYKVSIHVAAISALVTTVVIVYANYFIPLLLLIPLVGWARVKIKRHTVAETVIGGALGSVLALIMYYLMKIFLRA